MIVIRPLSASDVSFVMDSWKKSAWPGPTAERVLDSTVLVAELDLGDGLTEIVGWLCTSGRSVEMAYVKFVHRRTGVCSSLMDEAIPGWRNAVPWTLARRGPSDAVAAQLERLNCANTDELLARTKGRRRRETR